MNELESKVFDEIRGAIHGGYGDFDISVESNDVFIDVSGIYEWYFTRDTDYYSGTGECKTTHALVDIKNIEINGDVDFDINKIVNYIEDYMYNI